MQLRSGQHARFETELARRSPYGGSRAAIEVDVFENGGALKVHNCTVIAVRGHKLFSRIAP